MRIRKNVLFIGLISAIILTGCFSYAAISCADLFIEIKHLKEYFVPALQSIPRSEFSSIEKFHYADFGIYKTAIYHGKKVFLKSKSNHDREAMWLSVLNKHGVGVKLIGVTEIDGKSFLVTEFIEGSENSKFVDKNPSDIKLTSTMVAEVKRQLLLVVKLGASPVDIQFLFTGDGRVILLDTEFMLEREGWLGNDQVAIDNWIDLLVGFIVDPWKKHGRYRD